MKVEKAQAGNPTEQGGEITNRKHQFPASRFMIFLLVTSFTIIVIEKVIPGITTVTITVAEDTVEFYFIYVAFAWIGVAFHLMTQYRKMRDQDGFDWKQYRSDYSFRALQAAVYVMVIGSLVDQSATSMVTALFVGMYIRRVEAVFEDVGDRFGDTLRGMLGTTVQRLSPAENRLKRQELQKRFLALKKDYEKLKAKLEVSDRQKLGNELLKTQTLIQKGKVEPAESKLLSLDFQIKDFQIKL